MKVVHSLDEQVIGFQNLLEKVKKSSLEELFTPEGVKELIENGINPQDSKKALIETYEAQIFILHIGLLESIFHYITVPHLLVVPENNDLNTSFSTPRELFDVLQQLPPSVVEKELGGLCEERNSYMLLNSYKEKDKERFIQSFEQTPNNSEIMTHFRYVIKRENFMCDVREFQNTEHMTLSDAINVVESLEPDMNALAEYYGNMNYEYIKPLFANPAGYLEGKPVITIQGLKDLYKKVITLFIKLDDKLNDFEKNVIDNVIKESGFADIYNELYPQCLKEVQQDNIKEEGKTLEPIDFPEHLGIELEKRESFLRALYKELVGKSYISPNREDDFVYLLGGKIARPDDLKPINWLKGSNRNMRQIQCFFIAYLDIPQKVENKNDHNWTVLAPLNTWDGETMTTFNNPSNAFVKGINEINRFKNTLSVISSNI